MIPIVTKQMPMEIAQNANKDSHLFKSQDLKIRINQFVKKLSLFLIASNTTLKENVINVLLI